MQEGTDSLITLRVDQGKPLEERIHLLSYAFAKVVQGSVLKQIVSWNICEGEVQFILAAGPSNPTPEGIVYTKIENYPNNEVQMLVQLVDE